MRRNGQIAAGLLVVAVAAAGCSNSNQSQSPVSNPETHSAKMTPVSMTTNAPLDAKKSNAVPVKIGPAKFADGESAYAERNYTEAAKIFDQYTEEKPRNAWGHYMLGLSSWKAGDLAKSEKAFNEALSIDPDHFKSLLNLSRILIDQKRFDEAVTKLNHADELDPKSAEVQRLLGRIYDGQGKLDDAVMAYRNAIALDDKDSWSMNNLGFIFIGQKRYEDAVPLLTKAVELQPNVPLFRNNLGMALEHTKGFTAAAAEYKGALTADPKNAKAQQNLDRVEAVKVSHDEDAH